MIKIAASCKCGRTLNIHSKDKFNIREISVTCECGIGIIINANGITEKHFDLDPPKGKKEEGVFKDPCNTMP